MTTITKTLAARQNIQYIRPFDIRRDLEGVVSLVELCFDKTLDENGRRYLRRMREMANNPTMLKITALTSELAAVPLAGFVWEKDGRLLGNVSLVPYTVNRQRSYLIANVAVHPDYRRQGIARSLTDKALLRARMRGVSSVWLHVRQENQAAIELYTNFKFVERTRRTNWVDDPRAAFDFMDERKNIKVNPANAAHWGLQRYWLGQSHPPEFSWHQPVKSGLLRPDLLGWLYRAFSGSDVRTWSAQKGDRLLSVLSAHNTLERGAVLWLAAPPDGDPAAVGALLAHARQRSLPRQSLNLEYPAGHFTQAIQGAGFRQQQTLIWMRKEFF